MGDKVMDCRAALAMNSVFPTLCRAEFIRAGRQRRPQTKSPTASPNKFGPTKTGAAPEVVQGPCAVSGRIREARKDSRIHADRASGRVASNQLHDQTFAAGVGVFLERGRGGRVPLVEDGEGLSMNRFRHCDCRASLAMTASEAIHASRRHGSLLKPSA